jgi:hypothetical protein
MGGIAANILRPMGWIGWSDDMADIPLRGCRMENFIASCKSAYAKGNPRRIQIELGFCFRNPVLSQRYSCRMRATELSKIHHSSATFCAR